MKTERIQKQIKNIPKFSFICILYSCYQALVRKKQRNSIATACNTDIIQSIFHRGI